MTTSNTPPRFPGMMESVTQPDSCVKSTPPRLHAVVIARELLEFTGISAPYEPPEHPELSLDTGHESIAASLAKLVNYVVDKIPLGKTSRY